MAVVPLLSLAVPAGFLAVFTGWAWPAAAAGWLLGFARSVVDWHAAWEPQWRIPDPPLWVGIGLSATLILLAASGCWRPRWRFLTGAGVAAMLGLLLWHPFPPEVQAGRLEFTAVDVGQGDSFFIALPDGKLMLLDTGGFASYGGRPSGLDTGEDIISPYLWSRSIKRLDVVAVSHPHSDHAGGLDAILRNFHPREVWTGVPGLSREARELREHLRGLGQRTRTLSDGEGFSYGGARIHVLAPSVEGAPESANPDQNSLVFSLRYGKRLILTTGDMEPSTESLLAGSGTFGRADVLKVPHHGSRKSTGDGMLAEVRPTLALISAGYENAYNHPHREVLERLEKWRATPLRTDLLGLVSVRTDGTGLELVFRWCD
jgi:competence protein ComEC